MSEIETILRGAEPVPCAPWSRYVLNPASWQALAAAAAPPMALWADTTQVHALYADEARNLILIASCAVQNGRYPALSPLRPGARWFERMIADLWGHAAEGGVDARPWLDHGRWPNTLPMAARPGPPPLPPEPPEFLPVPGAEEGGDLHQVPVGPIHAGIIEPGHFRFSCLGEAVMRMEARLGYTHKGTLGLMRGKSPRAAARFAARLSGDATVAHSIAFARAAEAACGIEAPPRAAALRAVMAEVERVAVHLGDIGAIINDAAFSLGLARFGWHREMVLRATAAAFGHRLMMDVVVPGGVVTDIAPGGAEALREALRAAADEMPALARFQDDVASLADRLIGTGIVPPGMAEAFAAGGTVGRAAGRDADARRWPGYPPYDTLSFAVPVRTEGDTDARVRVRFAELEQSMAMIQALLARLPEGPLSIALPTASGEGIGVAETFRGDAWHWLRLDHGAIAASFVRDPSWAHWPLLEAAVQDIVVADFPLCNRSFNAAYSGVDL
ncbi:MAG: nickel-dependent hydrogenase large subunit [Proteobacteria bacterium]|nr:nickel-dependent hydrogenase large subunit [Pseudomonadota bacterium]